MSKQVAVIDIGTSGIRILAAKINDTGIPHIIAKSAVACNAIKRYEIEDENGLTESISSALKKIKDQTGIIIKSAYINISANNLKFVNNSDVISIPDEEGEITAKHVGQVLDKTASVEVYEDEKLVDIIPLKFWIDEEKNEPDPIGLYAEKLRVDAKVVLGKKEYIDQITKCVNNAGVNVDGYVPFSVSMIMLLPETDDNINSRMLIDVGGQVTEYVIYYRGKPFSVGTIPVGGDSITNDLAQVFKISLNEAESIKKDYPLASLDVLSNNIDVAVFSLESGTQEILKVAEIVEVMQARIEYIFELIRDKLEEEDIETNLIDQVILTGDGISKFKGVDKVCQNILESPLSLVDFSRLTGMKSIYTLTSGILMYISSQLPLGRKQSVLEREFMSEENNTINKMKDKSIIVKFLEKFKEMIASFRE